MSGIFGWRWLSFNSRIFVVLILGDGTGLVYLYMIFSVLYQFFMRNTTSLNTFNMGQMKNPFAY